VPWQANSGALRHPLLKGDEFAQGKEQGLFEGRPQVNVDDPA
jgi:hypothetical protein